MKLKPREIYTVDRSDGSVLVIEPGHMGVDTLRIGDVTWSLELLASVGDMSFGTPDGEAVRVVVKNGARSFERVVLGRNKCNCDA